MATCGTGTCTTTSCWITLGTGTTTSWTDTCGTGKTLSNGCTCGEVSGEKGASQAATKREAELEPPPPPPPPPPFDSDEDESDEIDLDDTTHLGDRLRAFYAVFKPDKAQEDLRNIVQYYIGEEDELNDDLREQYGADLTAVRPATLEEKLRSFYAVHNPQKLEGDIGPIVEYYEGEEDELNDDLREQYGGEDLKSVAQFACGGGGPLPPPAPPAPAATATAGEARSDARTGAAADAAREAAATSIQRLIRGALRRMKVRGI